MLIIDKKKNLWPLVKSETKFDNHDQQTEIISINYSIAKPNIYSIVIELNKLFITIITITVQRLSYLSS